jgi:hypothetical protein
MGSVLVALVGIIIPGDDNIADAITNASPCGYQP